MSNKHLYPDEKLLRFKPYLLDKTAHREPVGIPLSPSGKPQQLCAKDRGIIALHQSLTTLLDTVFSKNPKKTNEQGLTSIKTNPLTPCYEPLNQVLPIEYDPKRSSLDGRCVVVFAKMMGMNLDVKELNYYIKKHGFREVHACLERMSAIRLTNPQELGTDPVAYFERMLHNTDLVQELIQTKINNFREQELQRRQSLSPSYQAPVVTESNYEPLPDVAPLDDGLSPTMTALLQYYQTLNANERTVFQNAISKNAQGLIKYMVLPSPQSDLEKTVLEYEELQGNPYDETFRYFFHPVMLATLLGAKRAVDKWRQTSVNDDANMPVIPQSYFDELSGKAPIYEPTDVLLSEAFDVAQDYVASGSFTDAD